jgi:putative Ca2+/H+ antiporter (TMEM165/GDT1 family)
LEALLVSTGTVALAELGDKTQLLAFMLAARFRKPLPIVLGILVATLANHGIAGALGVWITSLLSPMALRWVLGLSFIAIAVWMFVPDQLDAAGDRKLRLGVFGTTLACFFLAEMGDKTQIATIALAARFHDLVSVVVGTTLGMMLANVPAVYLGERFAQRMPNRLLHSVAAAVFALLGLATLLGMGRAIGL